MMKANIISIGDELLIGQTVNTIRHRLSELYYLILEFEYQNSHPYQILRRFYFPNYT
jgi:hypothetical protein